MTRLFGLIVAGSMAAAIGSLAGCQNSTGSSSGYDTGDTRAGTYNPHPGLPDNTAGTSVYNHPNSMEHVGNQSDSGVLGGGTAHDPNAATPGS